MFSTALSALSALLVICTLTPPLASANPAPIVIRDSPVTVSFSRRLNITSGRALYQRDIVRARALKARSDFGHGPGESKRAVISTAADNYAVSYIAHVGVGSPLTQYSLIIDTGSSNTWIGATKKYVNTSTSVNTGDAIGVKYGSGSFNGTEYLDTVTLGPGLVIKKQSIGVASISQGFEGVDGILGIGPQILTIDTLLAKPNQTIPTVTDNLFTAGTISSHSIGISFAPVNTQHKTNGEITWGGIDRYKTFGPITYIPITSTSPSKFYWGIDSSISYGFFGNKVILSKTAGIVDTGTTLLLIATDAFQRYQTATRATFDEPTTLLTLTPSNYRLLQNLRVFIGRVAFDFTPNAQRWPRALNTVIGGKPDGIYLIVADLGSKSGEGLDFILGQSWLERFYSVYDTTNKRVGIANTFDTWSRRN